MPRQLVKVGIAVLTVFTMGTAGSVVASAEEFHFSAESTVLTGEALGTQTFRPTAKEKDEFRCEEVSIEEGAVEGEDIETLTFKPKYDECVAEAEGEELLASVDFTECAYAFTSGTSKGKNAEVRVACPNEGEYVHFRVTALNLECMDIPKQEVLGVHYENTGEASESEQETLDLDATVDGVVTTTKSVCVAPEESATHNKGTLSGLLNLKGHDTLEEPSDVSYG